MLITSVLLLIMSSAYTMNETKDHSNEETTKVTVVSFMSFIQKVQFK